MSVQPRRRILVGLSTPHACKRFGVPSVNDRAIVTRAAFHDSSSPRDRSIKLGSLPRSLSAVAQSVDGEASDDEEYVSTSVPAGRIGW